MKALKLVALGIVLFFASAAQAQISVRLNLGTAPAWGPSGYSDVQYYYLPDVEAYYDVNTSMFIYYEGRSWVRRSYLPSRYKNYDLYGGYKVVMNGYHGKTPYYKHNEYRTKYAKGYRGPSQRSIGERPGRGNNNRDYRQSNPVNNGRGNVINRNDRRGDNSYDKRGNENKNNKRGSDNRGNGKNDRGNDNRK